MTAADRHDARERTDRRAGLDTELSAAATREILETRARYLARPLPEPASSGDTRELLVFTSAGEAYAVDSGSVVEVVLLAGLTPLPSTPPAVAGVVNHRGRIVAVVDMAALVAAAAQEDRGAAKLAVVVISGEAIFALRAEATAGVLAAEARDVLPADHLADRPDGVVCGLTPALAAILDLEAIARDPRVRIDDQLE